MICRAKQLVWIVGGKMRKHLRVIVPYPDPCCGPDQPTTQNSFQVLWQVFLLGGSVQQTKQTCQQERERECHFVFFSRHSWKKDLSHHWFQRIIQFDLRIFFRMGSFNHQPDNIMLLLQGGPISRNDSEKKRRCLDRCDVLFFVGSLGIPIVICPGKRKKHLLAEKMCPSKRQILEPDGWVGERTLDCIWLFFVAKL